MSMLTTFTTAMTVYCILFPILLNYVTASGTCNTDALNMARNLYHKRRLRSRVVASQPISKPIDCYVRCIKNCRCVSYNVCNGGKLCELNSEKKENNIPLYVSSDDCDYHDFSFNRQLARGCKDPCCVTSQPCTNGAPCQATCMENGKRYQCGLSEESQPEENPSDESLSKETPSKESPSSEENPSEESPSEENLSDENPSEENPSDESPAEENPSEESPSEENPPKDQIKDTKPRSCAFYVKSENRTSGLRLVYGPGEVPYHVFCHFIGNSVHTLVMSYSLQNQPYFSKQPMSKNFPASEDSPNWEKYRLSHARMAAVLDESGVWKLLCSYQLQGWKEDDTVRFAREDLEPLDGSTGVKCVNVKKIRVKGQGCEKCTIAIAQGAQAWHMKYDHVKYCGGKPVVQVLPDLPCKQGRVSYFGNYNSKCIDKTFSCTSSNEATTQLWFAHKL